MRSHYYPCLCDRLRRAPNDVPGVWGFFILVTATTPQVPLRYYAIDFGIISGGLGMIRR
jgi:hypothetical protein